MRQINPLDNSWVKQVIIKELHTYAILSKHNSSY